MIGPVVQECQRARIPTVCGRAFGPEEWLLLHRAPIASLGHGRFAPLASGRTLHWSVLPRLAVPSSSPLEGEGDSAERKRLCQRRPEAMTTVLASVPLPFQRGGARRAEGTQCGFE